MKRKSRDDGAASVPKRERKEEEKEEEEEEEREITNETNDPA